MQKIRIGKLDFQDIKDSLKNYLSQQTEFTDYNFEGSNMSQLLNILAYNAHYDALAANFLANEVFLDTATKRSSVISRAKELGYNSRSRRASSTQLNIKIANLINADTTSSVLLPKGTRFTTKVNDESFVFTTKEGVILDKQIELGAPIFVGTVTVYEGILTQNLSTYDGIDNTITIPNTDVDTTTIKVELYEDSQWVEWTQPQSFMSVTSTSKVYMIQEGFNGYEIYFGDGVLGKKPPANTPIRMTYIVTSGDTANGASVFSLTSELNGVNSNTIITLTPNSPTAGGLLEESVESVKLNAKNSYGTQNRAVVADDYADLAQQNFEQVKEVLAWDGSTTTPPRFGKVVLCVKPTSGAVLSSVNKKIISDFLIRKGVGNIKIDFIDPEYINIEVDTTLKYSVSDLQLSPYELEYVVKDAITNYAGDSINKFRGVFRYSNLVSLIDSADYSISSNETIVTLNKEVRPNLYAPNNFVFTYSNQILKGTFKSTKFNDGILANKLFLMDVNGKIHSYYSINGKNVIYHANVGTINYITGDVVLNNILMSNVDDMKFKLSVKPATLDIYSSQNIILTLVQSNIKVKAIKDTIQ